MNEKSFHDRLVEELRREREAIDEVIQAHEVFMSKLSRLPPDIIRRVSRALDATHVQASETNFEKIAEFLRSKGNEPQPTRAIQKATGLSRGALAFVLYTSHKDRLNKFAAPGQKRKKLWSLKETLRERVARDEAYVESLRAPLREKFAGRTDVFIPISLADKTSIECAKQILSEHANQPMHFGAIAKEAISRGYIGKPTDDEIDPAALQHRIAQSMWAAMHRAPEVFEKAGKGLFRLTAETDPTL